MGLALLAGSALVAAIPQDAQFGDWNVACDNLRHCEALAAIEHDGEHDDWTLHVVRDGEGDAEPKLFAQQAFGQPEEVRLVLDGKVSSFGFDNEGAPRDDTRQLLAALAVAEFAEVVNEEGEVGRFPVRGATAALRWIDDRQKRADTATALVARGLKPVDTVPPLPLLPRIEQPPRSSADLVELSSKSLAKLLAFSGCAEKNEGVEYHRLDAGHTLGLTICWRGAYQSAYLVFVVDERGQWTLAPIEQPRELDRDPEPNRKNILTSADFFEDARLLVEFAKYRAHTDCGRTASWAWDGNIFRLASFSELATCRGGPLGTFLPRWRTANAEGFMN